jgi:hypothetical protein
VQKGLEVTVREEKQADAAGLFITGSPVTACGRQSPATMDSFPLLLLHCPAVVLVGTWLGNA